MCLCGMRSKHKTLLWRVCLENLDPIRKGQQSGTETKTGAIIIYFTSSFARSATSPSYAYVSNPAPDSSLCRAAGPRLHPLQLLFPDCVRFGCWSPIASASTAGPRLRLLQLQLPDCICFDCCSPIASASSLTCSERFQPVPIFSDILCQAQLGYSKLKYEGRASLV